MQARADEAGSFGAKGCGYVLPAPAHALTYNPAACQSSFTQDWTHCFAANSMHAWVMELIEVVCRYTGTPYCCNKGDKDMRA